MEVIHNDNVVSYAVCGGSRHGGTDSDMPGLPVNVVKTVLSGKIAGSQSWSTSPWWISPFGGTTPLQSEMNAFAVAVRSQFATQAGSWMSPMMVASTTFTSVTAYWYPAGSLVATSVSAPATGTANGVGTDQLPSLLACVVSLHSPVPGKSGRGRAYLPLTKVAALGTDGQVTSAALNNVLTGWKAALNNVESLTTWVGPPEPCIASFTKGDVYALTSLSANSLVDTQHRREDSIATTTNLSVTL